MAGAPRTNGGIAARKLGGRCPQAGAGGHRTCPAHRDSLAGTMLARPNQHASSTMIECAFVASCIRRDANRWQMRARVWNPVRANGDVEAEANVGVEPQVNPWRDDRAVRVQSSPAGGPCPGGHASCTRATGGDRIDREYSAARVLHSE